MKLAESITNSERGQSLLELLIAMSIFVLTVSAVMFLILDTYLADRVGRERMTATFLAKEGLEAARSIRDNNWSNLTVGSHGLTISGGHWIFQGTEEDVSGQLKDGERKIIVEKDSDRATVTSQVIWKLTETRLQEVNLITYLTNWKPVAEEAPSSCDDACQGEEYSEGTCKSPPACPDENELGGSGEYGCAANKLCCCK